MTTHSLPPAELHAELQARLAAARTPRVRTKARQPRGRIRTKAAVLGAAALLLATVVLVLGATDIDLTTADAQATDANGGVWIQGGVGAGTGNFDPFLTLKSNADTEKGINVCDDPGCPAPQFDTFTGGGRTHELLISAVPEIEYQGGIYREFSLDANDQGNDDWMSIDVVEIYRSTNRNLTGYPALAGATLVYELPVDADVLMRSQTLSPGSGVSDVTLLVPDDLFPADCYYGSLTCDQYLFFYTESGGVGVRNGQNYNVTAGFEEWRVSLQPVVNVTKTATPTFDRTYDWTIDKTVDPDTLDLFNGDSGTVTWSITPTRGAAQDANWRVTGTITVMNPTGDSDGPISEDIDATVNSVSDLIDGTIDVGADGTLTCPAFPVTLGGGESLECTYSYSYGSDPGTDDHTNVATANIDISDTDTMDYDGSSVFNFGSATPTVTDDTATLTDARLLLDQPAEDGVPVDVEESFACPDDEGTQSNTARVTESDSGDFDEDSASVDVNCYALTVTKDASTSIDRDYDWDISKTRVIVEGENDGDDDPSTLTLQENQTYVVSYEVTVTMTGFSDDNWAVSGTITVDNPAPIDAEDVVVSDEISGIGAVDVDCDPATLGNQDTVDVPAEDSVECTYSSDLPNGSDRTNTATATLFGEEYTGEADVLFDEDTTVNETDKCIDVTDDAGTPDDTGDDIDLGTVCLEDLDAEDSFTFEAYTIEIGPFDCGEHEFTNEATFVASDTDETGSATYTISIDVPCPEGCTLTLGYWKTHNDSFWGGAPTDEIWELLGPAAEETSFFLSGQTYFEVLWTAGKGNAYYQLARQYIAAELNVLAGADDTDIADAFADATDLLNTYAPAEIGALKGNNAIRAQFISLAGTLGSFNEGLIGPGHCDEDQNSASGFLVPPLLPVRRRYLQ